MENKTRRKGLDAILLKLFQEILPLHNYLPRDKQSELATEIMDAFSRSEIFLAEAEVGIGKTLAYLLPAALMKREKLNEGRIPTTLIDGSQAPIVIATSSIALQRAIEQDYIPALSDILMKHGIIKTPLTRVLRKGKGHYICDRRLAHFYTFADKNTKTVLESLISGNLVDLAITKGLTPYMKRAVCVDEHCGQDCPHLSKCRYIKYLKSAKQGSYDFQICNHNYLLADVLHRAKRQRPLISDFQAVIIDEAHRFLDAARQMYGCALSVAEFRCMVKEIQEISFVADVSTADIWIKANQIRSKAELLFQFLNKEVCCDNSDDATDQHPTIIRKRTERVIIALKEDVDSLNAMLLKRSVRVKYQRRIKKIIRSLLRISESLATFIFHDQLIYWLENGTMTGGFGVLWAIPKELGRILHRDLWNKEIPFVLTSATLSASGSFEHSKHKLGLDLVSYKRLRETTKPSPFNHRENVLLYISENTSFPNNRDEKYIKGITDETKQLIGVSHGHAAVLFTSYKAMDMVYAQIVASDIPYPIFRLDRGANGAIERFSNSKNGVLFASGVLWEGIDIPGDILSMLIVVRLPFAVPDPLSRWEQTLYAKFDDYKENVVVPEMLIKLKQGFGRLIRSESDTGVVAILDSRANIRGAYRRRVLAALPPCAVTSRILNVERFFQDKKHPTYFDKPDEMSSGRALLRRF